MTGARLIWRSAQVLADSSLPDGEIIVLEGVLAEHTGGGVTFHRLRDGGPGPSGTWTCTWSCRRTRRCARRHAMAGEVKAALAAALPGTEVLIHIEDADPLTGDRRRRNGSRPPLIARNPHRYRIVPSEGGW